MILASVFRDSAGYLDRYQAQIKALREEMDVYVVAVEGDSRDDTWQLLQDTDFYVLKSEHGGPSYGSTDHPVRWRQIASACNVAMIAATRLCEPDEPFCYIESDLIWEPETILTLVDDLTRVAAVAPMSMCQGRFYDTWGYRRNGERFVAEAPYHPRITTDSLTPIESAGSCFVTLGHYLPFLNFSPDTCIRGIGQSLSDNGWQLFLDPTVSVEHPAG